MIIGGGMAFTFIKEAGVEIGASLYDEEGAKLVPEIKKKAEEKGVELILPVDFVCSSKFGEDGEIQDGDMDTGVPEGFLGLDIGPKSIAMNDEAIKKSKTIVPRLHRVFEASRSVRTERIFKSYWSQAFLWMDLMCMLQGEPFTLVCPRC